MNFIKTALRNVKIIEPESFGDNRGWFMETYSKKKFSDAGVEYDFVQDNQSFSNQKGIIRGLHYQKHPMAQAKLVRCTEGAILDVAVDLKKGSDTYLKYVAVELSDKNKRQLMIPRGFAHGFLTLTDNVSVQYKVDNLYSKEFDRSIRYNDPSIGIEWGIDNPILSEKDKTSLYLAESDADFTIKVLVTGANGQLGYDIIKKLTTAGYDCKGVDKEDFDITDKNTVVEFIKNYNPDVVVHCSAYTAVDKAEENQELCYKVNVEGSRNIAKACESIDAKMVYISTDYVFDGKGDKPFETFDKVSPLSNYGKTKLSGEIVCRETLDKLFIIRTSWVFGINGNNFVKTIRRLAINQNSINVVNDQIGSPTYTVDLANFIFFIIQTDKYGTYHCSNEGFCSWFDFACAILKGSGLSVAVKGIPTSEYKTVAIRPMNSRLSKKSLEDCGYGQMPTWQNALERFLEEIKMGEL